MATVAALALQVAGAAAQAPVSVLSDPLGLARLKDYEPRRATSNNLYVESNDDSKRPIPGETLVLADLEGPGVVTHIWMTIAANEYGWPRLLRFRVYYDGSKTPSVDVPLGDFFAAGHGYERNVDSLMIRNSSNGRARNSYWPMPFRKSCRITITNEGSRRVSMLYYQVDWQKHRELPPDVGYFHAYYRQELPAIAGKDYEVLNVTGRGHLVGALINVVQTEVGWFGEGDDLFYVDGSAKPVMEGTGTEDYFLDAWSLRASSGLMAGIPIAEGQGVGARISGYRWHLADPVPFKTSLRFDIEHSGWTYAPDGTARTGFEERYDLWSSVAFWYQEGVNDALPEPPYGAARLPHGNARQIEVEELVDQAIAEGGQAIVQREVFWSKDLLFLRASGKDAKITIPFDIPEDGYYEILGQIAHAADYGTYVAAIDGQPIGAGRSGRFGPRPINAYGPELYVAADHLIDWLDLTKGRHTVTFTCVGKDEASSGYHLGIDDLVIARISDKARVRRGPAPGPVAAAGDDQGRALRLRSGQASSAPTNRIPAAQSAPAAYRGKPLATYVEALAAPAASDRASAARAIGQFGADGVPALPVLIGLLRDPDTAVREASVESIALFGRAAAPAVDSLAPLLADPSARLRGLAALALREIGPGSTGALPQLIAALKDRDLTVRYEVGLAIAALGPAAKSAVPALMTAMDEEPDDWVSVARRDIRRAMAIALGEIGPDAKEALPLLYKWMRFYRVAWVAAPVIRKIEGKPAPATYR